MTDAEIVTRYRAGEPLKLLRTGSTNEPVYRALRRAGVEPRGRRLWWPEAQALFDAGMSKRQIAQRLGKDRASVIYALRQMQESRG
jgi:hypothetical protein